MSEAFLLLIFLAVTQLKNGFILSLEALLSSELEVSSNPFVIIPPPLVNLVWRQISLGCHLLFPFSCKLWVLLEFSYQELVVSVVSLSLKLFPIHIKSCVFMRSLVENLFYPIFEAYCLKVFLCNWNKVLCGIFLFSFKLMFLLQMRLRDRSEFKEWRAFLLLNISWNL